MSFTGRADIGAIPLTLVNTSYGPLWTIASDGGCSKTIRDHGDYSELEMAVMRSYVNSESVVLDVGANIGAFTIPLAQIAKEVHAFEPQAEVREVLQQNIDANHLTNVVIHPFALGFHKKTGYYTYMPGGPGMAQVRDEGKSPVDVIPLDELKLAPDFIKMDCEGMEVDVLAGGVNTITTQRPPMFMERQIENKELYYILSLMKYCNFEMALPVYLPNNRAGCTYNNHPNEAHMMNLALPQEYRR